MILTLPENIKEITLGQYQRFDVLNKRTDLSELSYNKRVIEIFTELKYRDIGNISNKDYTDILIQLTKAMEQTSEFEDTFKIQDIEFGFVPNLDDITTAEFVDLSNWGLEVENFHKIMAILFRPITNRDGFKNYQIENYEGTKKYSEAMKLMPMNIVNGALGFFSLLAKELREHTLKSMTEEEQQKEAKLLDTLKNGDGIVLL
jgi:hypothetical protein|tara:strand:+ start:171 stop:779 length:609 start_codon:yes stop_codon:yes gene_type:complete